MSFVVRRCMLLNVHDTVFNLTLSSLLFTFSFKDFPPKLFGFVCVFGCSFFSFLIYSLFALLPFSIHSVGSNAILRVRFDQCVMEREPLDFCHWYVSASTTLKRRISSFELIFPVAYNRYEPLWLQFFLCISFYRWTEFRREYSSLDVKQLKSIETSLKFGKFVNQMSEIVWYSKLKACLYCLTYSWGDCTPNKQFNTWIWLFFV